MTRIFVPLVAALCFVAAPAAAQVTVNSTAANFYDAAGGNAAFYQYQNSDALAGNEIFRFGEPATGAGPNVFTFTSAGSTPAAINSPFDLGVLSLTNRPAYDNPSTVSLSLTSSITGEAGTFSVPFLFQLAIDNTINSTPCAYPSTEPCADAVTFAVLTGTGTFMDGGTTYTLSIDGFRDSGGNQTAMFIGQENATTTATVVGRFIAFTPGIPEPATWAMMIAGFGLVGASMRRRVTVAYA